MKKISTEKLTVTGEIRCGQEEQWMSYIRRSLDEYFLRIKPDDFFVDGNTTVYRHGNESATLKETREEPSDGKVTIHHDWELHFDNYEALGHRDRLEVIYSQFGFNHNHS